MHVQKTVDIYSRLSPATGECRLSMVIVKNKTKKPCVYQLLCLLSLYRINILRIIPTPWEITLSRLLSIVSDFERESHLKYKLA